ncbi:hypothetical protein P3G55_01865 [Leptospira sp. 96542]|nr:hypothetical protein [Leptospira sp. 96542]
MKFNNQTPIKQYLQETTPIYQLVHFLHSLKDNFTYLVFFDRSN